MPQWNDFFMRDSPNDTGTVPSPGYPYWSPDIICTQTMTYADPQSRFGIATWGQMNLCQNVIAQQDNYFYARAKNMSTATQGCRLFLYAMPPSLAMVPSTWSNPLSIVLPNGTQQAYCDVPAVGQNGVAVTPTPFVWSAGTTSVHYCAAGICSTPANPFDPASPPSFANFDDFVLWIRNHQMVCWRNLQLIPNPNVPEWDSTAAFANTFTGSVPLLVAAFCSNVPVGTSVTLHCSALPGFDVTAQVTDPNMTIYANPVTCPSGFSGLVQTTAQTPAGVAWGNAQITTVAMVGSDNSIHPAARFDGQTPFGKVDRGHPSVRAAYGLTSGQGTLLTVGSNTMAAVAPSTMAQSRAMGDARGRK